MTEQRKKIKGLTVKILGVSLFILLLWQAIRIYFTYLAPNVVNTDYIYIRTGTAFANVMDSIRQKEILKDTSSFIQAVENMNYKQKVKPGRYRLKEGMNNRQVINMLKAGNQEKVQLRFHHIRLKKEFCRFIAQKLETDSTALLHLLDSSAFIDRYGFNRDNVYAMFIPNSYDFYWNTTAEKFFKRMYKEYQLFWNEERRSKSKKIKLTPIKVSILAAIVDAEALHDDEMPMIAGLYLNRYNKGIRLQADPTVIFANNDFTIRRVLNKHLSKSSPYNTYQIDGLPPGPIMMPSIKAIDAVLNHKVHQYIYMCAKEDFSGYHNFAVTVAEHQANAKKFQTELNRRNIKK